MFIVCVVTRHDIRSSLSLLKIILILPCCCHRPFFLTFFLSYITLQLQLRHNYDIPQSTKQYDKSLTDAAFAYKHACESEQGWGRAYHLISVFGNDNNPNTFRVPNALFSYNYDDSVNCRTSRGHFRTQATIAPLAEYLGIHVNNSTGAPPSCGYEQDNVEQNCHPPIKGKSVSDYGLCCNTVAAEKIMKTLFSNGNQVHAVLAAWQHTNIHHLAFALGAPTENMKWDATDFDTVVALYFDVKTKKFIKFTKAKQGFEWIGPEMELPNID